MRHSLPLILCIWLSWLISEPAHSLSPASPEDCEAHDAREIQQLMPEIRHPFAEGELLQVCRLRQTGETSYYFASKINSEAINDRGRVCHYTSRRLFLSHDTPQEKRFTLEAPEGKPYLSRIYIHALTTTAAACPKQYSDHYAVIDGVSLNDYLAIKTNFDSQTATKKQALDFWRAHMPSNPGLVRVHKKGFEYDQYLATLNTIETTPEYSPPEIARLESGHPANHCSSIIEAATYSAMIDFVCAETNFKSATIRLYPKRQ